MTRPLAGALLDELILGISVDKTDIQGAAVDRKCVGPYIIGQELSSQTPSTWLR